MAIRMMSYANDFNTMEGDVEEDDIIFLSYLM